MMSKPGFTVALLIILMPCVTYAKEHGTVVDIWHQIDLHEHHYCIYRVETKTHFYELRGEYPQAFELGDSLTFALDTDHQHAQVIGGRGKNPKLVLIKEELKEIRKDPHEPCGECRLSVGVLPSPPTCLGSVAGNVSRDKIGRQLAQVTVNSGGWADAR